MAASTSTAPAGTRERGVARPRGFGFNDGRERALHHSIFSRPDLETTLRNDPAAVVAAVEDFASTHSRMMTFKPAKLEKCRALLADMSPRPKILVELGGYVGSSAVAWGQMLKALNGDSQEGDEKKIRVFSMELDEEFAAIACDLVGLAGLEDVVTVLRGQSTELLHELRTTHGVDKIDVLFLDHWEEFYLPDLRACEDLGLLKPGGLILADNTDYPGAPEYLAYVKAGGQTGRRGRSARSAVKYQSTSYETNVADKGAPSIVEATLVVDVPGEK